MMRLTASIGTEPELSLGAAVLEAAGLDDTERESYLRGLDATAPDLALRVRLRLAAADGLADSFLSTPAAARLAGAADEPAGGDEPPPGTSLPAAERYELGRCLGEGGMGRVLLAYDRQLARPVALKFLTQGSPALLRLFLAEARAQARVQHDHVLEVYDSGELDGRPYIAMRYVAGGTLADAAAQLPLEQKVRLLVQVAEGLHAAHREGLLHGDVKPSNVLLARTADGELKALVTDFGLATQLEDAGEMAAETVAGSPHYIAPERLGSAPSAVDRRSDVYSLGITLYWLFTGALPFGGQQTLDVLRQALFEPLPPPRRHLPTLPVELEAIILRCTARDPDRRYASARAVAVDLQRYLDGEVVDAYAAGLAYRLTRFALRHRLVVALAAVAAAALVAAGVGISIYALRADAARKRAEVRQRQAEGLIGFMLGDLRKTLEPMGRLDVLTAISDQAMQYFRAVPRSELSAEELLRRSEAMNQIAYVRMSRAEYGAALAAYQESLALARGLAARDPGNLEWQKRLGAAHFFVGKVYWDQGDRARALASFEAQLGIARRLAARQPHASDVQLELANALTNLGFVHRTMAAPERAAAAFGDARAILTREIRAHPDATDLQFEYANKTALVGELNGQLGEPGAALERFAEAQQVMERLIAKQPANAYWQERLAIIHLLRGNALRAAGELDGAERHDRACLALARHLVAVEPERADWRQHLAVAQRSLGDDLRLGGEPAAALGPLQKSLEILQKLVQTASTPVRQRLLAASHAALGGALARLGERAAAEHQARTALAGLEPLARQDPEGREVRRRLVAALLLLGETLGDSAPARAAWSRAAAVAEALTRGSSDLDDLESQRRLLEHLGERQRAAAVADRLAELRRQVAAVNARLEGGPPAPALPPASP